MSEDHEILYTKNPYMMPCETCGKFFNTFPAGSIVEVNYQGKIIKIIECKQCQWERLMEVIENDE
jgi:hypothetical protein